MSIYNSVHGVNYWLEGKHIAKAVFDCLPETLQTTAKTTAAVHQSILQVSMTCGPANFKGGRAFGGTGTNTTFIV